MMQTLMHDALTHDALTHDALTHDMMQLNTMAERAKQTTSCHYAAYGHGVTTGQHKVRRLDGISTSMSCSPHEPRRYLDEHVM